MDGFFLVVVFHRGGSKIPNCFESLVQEIQHSQLLNIIILKLNSPVLLNQLGNIFPYRSTSTGSVLENILPVELGVYFPVHS